MGLDKIVSAIFVSIFDQLQNFPVDVNGVITSYIWFESRR